MSERIAKSIKNAKVGLIVYAFDLLFTFFGRKYFIDILGPDLLGLNSISQSILRFLNLAELGIAAAVGFSLYQPLFNKDQKTINEIISLQGYFYRKIAFFIIGASIVLMAFFPLIFAKSGQPMYYAYASYIALSVSVLLSYWANYRQILFTADQKNYIVTYLFQGGRVVKSGLQILALLFLDPSYSFWVWLALEIAISLLSSAGLEWSIRKYYPMLKTSFALGKKVIHNYPRLMRTTKQVFFHKIGGFALSQSSPLIIYAYASLRDVTIFDNYNFIVLGIIIMFENLFNGMTAGIGNLIAEKNPEKVNKLYWELFAFRTFVCCTIATCTMFLSQPFITLWVGSQYIMPKMALFWLMGTFFIRIFRGSTDSFLNAFGLYKDIAAPIIEAVLNIGLSILFGYFWGISGILAGVFTSLFLVVFIWKPFFLFREKMQSSPLIYFKTMAGHILIVIVSILSTYFIKNFLPIRPENSYSSWFLYGFCLLVISGIISFSLFYIFTPGMRAFTARSLSFIRSTKTQNK